MDEILYLSKMAEGKMEFNPKLTNIANLIKTTVESFEAMQKEKGVNIVTNIDIDNNQISVDEMKIGQVLTNVIGNAFKFVPSKTGLIEVNANTFNAIDNKKRLLISIKDNGPGIHNKETLKTIFMPFVQGEEGSKSVHKGTGLGLAVCKQILAYHQGEIWATSEEGEGLTIKIIIPYEKIEEYVSMEELELAVLEDIAKNIKKI